MQVAILVFQIQLAQRIKEFNVNELEESSEVSEASVKKRFYELNEPPALFRR